MTISICEENDQLCSEFKYICQIGKQTQPKIYEYNKEGEHADTNSRMYNNDNDSS